MRSHVDCTDLGIWINVLVPFSRKRDLLGSFATVQERQKVSMEEDRFAPAGRWVSERSSYEMSYGIMSGQDFTFSTFALSEDIFPLLPLGCVPTACLCQLPCPLCQRRHCYSFWIYRNRSVVDLRFGSSFLWYRGRSRFNTSPFVGVWSGEVGTVECQFPTLGPRF